MTNRPMRILETKRDVALPGYLIECRSVRVPHAVTSGTFYVFIREDGTDSEYAYGTHDEARKGVVYDAFKRGLIDEAFRDLALTHETYDPIGLRRILDGYEPIRCWATHKTLDAVEAYLREVEDFWAARRAEVSA